MHEVQHAIQEIEDFARGGSRKRIESSLWYESGRLAYDLKKLAPPPEFYVLEKKRSTLSSKLFQAQDKVIEQNPLMEDNIIENTFNKKNFDKLKLRNTKELKEFKDVLTKYHETDNALDDMVKNHPIFKERKKISDKLDAVVKKDPYEEYKKLHGEAEARNVQNRLNFGGKTHPHETFDVNPDETIVSKDNIINLSHELERDFLSKDLVNLNALSKEAAPLPKVMSEKEFKAQFEANIDGIAHVKTPISDKFGNVSVDINKAWRHLNSDNSYFSDRSQISGAFLDTLTDPLFVVKQKYRAEVSRNPIGQFSQTRQNAKHASGSDGQREIVTQDSLIFYKPFETDDGITHLASFAVDANGNLIHKTFYDLNDNLGKLKALIKSTDKNVIYYKNSVGNENISYSRNIEEIKQEHPNVEKELDESIAAMRKESFNDVNFKDNLISKINAKDITTKQLGKSVDLSDKQLAVLKNDIKNADFKVISDSKIYFDKMGRDGDKKRFFIDIAEDGKVRVDGYSKKGIDTIPVRQSALEELAGVGDRERLKNMSFEVKAAYHNELDPIKKEAILKRAELNKLKKAAQSGDKMAVAKFEEFKARNLDENGNIKDGLSLC